MRLVTRQPHYSPPRGGRRCARNAGKLVEGLAIEPLELDGHCRSQILEKRRVHHGGDMRRRGEIDDHARAPEAKKAEAEGFDEFRSAFPGMGGQLKIHLRQIEHQTVRLLEREGRGAERLGRDEDEPRPGSGLLELRPDDDGAGRHPGRVGGSRGRHHECGGPPDGQQGDEPKKALGAGAFWPCEARLRGTIPKWLPSSARASKRPFSRPRSWTRSSPR